MPRPSFRQLLAVQLALVAVVYLASVAAFVTAAESIAERFTALARGPYLGTALLAQARVVPAYVTIAVALAFLARPWLRARPRAL
ncbi:MAG: hypothetical protein ACOZQL_14325, partial [Myxococcota bacterium]